MSLQNQSELHLYLDKHIENWINTGKELFFKKGECISMPGKLNNDVIIIKKGIVSEFHMHVDGKECIIGLLFSGDFIGLTDIFTSKENRVFAKALTDVTIVVVSKQEFRTIIKQSPTLAMILLNYISKKYANLINILEQIGYGSVENRVIYILEKISDQKQKDNEWYPIPDSITHKDIAGMIASTRETVTLTINKLVKKNEIRYQDGRIWIPKKDKDSSVDTCRIESCNCSTTSLEI